MDVAYTRTFTVFFSSTLTEKLVNLQNPTEVHFSYEYWPACAKTSNTAEQTQNNKDLDKKK